MGSEADRRFGSATAGRTPDRPGRAAAIVDHRPSAAAQRALRQTIHDGPRLSAQRQIMGAGVVQRLVGFEFETGYILTQQRGAAGGWGRHAKGATLQSFPGYRVTADDSDNGNSQLEIIFDPFDEADPIAVKYAQDVGDSACQTIDAIAAGAFSTPRAYHRADQIAGLNGKSRDRYKSNVGAAGSVSGQLQMTAGLEMAKLHAHVTGAKGSSYAATLDIANSEDDSNTWGLLAAYTGQSNNSQLAITATAAATARLGGPHVSAESLDQLGAVAGMMAMFPVLSRHKTPPDYAKAAAGPWMARTDFSKILTLLPADVLQVLTGADLEHIVVATVNGNVPPAKAVAGGDPVLDALAPGNPDLSKLTINAWTHRVVPSAGAQGKDRLTKKHFPGGKTKRRAMESVGGYGDKLDPSDTSAGKPIFEFRGLGNMTAADLKVQLGRMVRFLKR